ncbi:hypothetical protein [Mycobacteroides abscessus]|uniref:hypothetical protein n=1 Tax=Mycobacteroides abscessus TaxID=36809 RepID=UPI0009A57243|nr:hypothetical protein [Mycobacteroides abscessus]MBN7314138.1 hypothetical protein [Mycobacteroides abscessus subsp. abscessus]SKG10491.1 Uncharacterised protein [Mycobacteroides abscessus subsp. massiliense]
MVAGTPSESGELGGRVDALSDDVAGLRKELDAANRRIRSLSIALVAVIFALVMVGTIAGIRSAFVERARADAQVAESASQQASSSPSVAVEPVPQKKTWADAIPPSPFDQTFAVGEGKDVLPGAFRSADNSDCYWRTYRGGSQMSATREEVDGGQQGGEITVTLEEGTYFEVNHCTWWHRTR